MYSEYDPNFYAHLGDDSAMIQAAVDVAAQTGETVTVPRRNERTGRCLWEITHAIRLHTGSVICLDNCVLRQADGMFENIFINSNQDTPQVCTREGRQFDIKIYGLGNALLDGGRHNGFTENTQADEGKRPVLYNSMFNFVNTERVSIKNLRIVNQRYWAITFHYSSHGRIANIDFYAPHTVVNQDGIDLRTGCSHFLIENITGCTGDDTVALTCLTSRFDEAMRAAGLDDGLHHVMIRNICTCTPCAMVRLLNHDGKPLYNITVENIMESTERDPARLRDRENEPLDPVAEKLRVGACVRIGENYYYNVYGSGKAQPEDTYNVTVRGVTGRMRTGIRVSCALSNAVLDNVQIYGDGGTGIYFGEGTVKNIRVSNVGYSLCHEPRPTDDNRRENHFTQQPVVEADPNRELCAVYFKETEAENILFRNIHASDRLTAVFGGTGHVRMKAENIVRESEKTPLFDGKLRVEKMKISEF